MAGGLRPARGKWQYRLLDVLSTATFVKGSAVYLNGARTVSEMNASATTATHVLGIALHGSADSCPPGKVLVAIPSDRECTFIAPTGATAASSLSLGQGVALVKSGNTFDQLSASVITRHAQVAGPFDSTKSEVELAFLTDALQLFSTTTQAI